MQNPLSLHALHHSALGTSSRIPAFAVGFAALCLAGSLAVPLAEAGQATWGPRLAARPDASRPATVVAAASVDDPAADTFGAGPTQIDIAGYSAEVDGGDLVLGASFHHPISPSDSGMPDAVTGFLDLDTDQSGATGTPSAIDLQTPLVTGMGVEFYVDLFSYSSSAGTAAVIDDASETLAGTAAVTFSAMGFEVRVPLSVIADDGAVNTVALLGTTDEPTDAVPNGGLISSAGPGPGAVLLQDDRFAVEVAWRDHFGDTGVGQMAVRSDDSANFWFFRQDNWELLIKVLDGCPVNGHFWVFSAAVTDVEYTITVTDTESEQTQVYSNVLGDTPVSVTDTAAFATCP